MNKFNWRTKKFRIFKIICQNFDYTNKEIKNVYESMYEEPIKKSTVRAYKSNFKKMMDENIEINETSGVRNYGSENSPLTWEFWVVIGVVAFTVGWLFAVIFR